jgi:hypothetical protein
MNFTLDKNSTLQAKETLCIFTTNCNNLHKVDDFYSGCSQVSEADWTLQLQNIFSQNTGIHCVFLQNSVGHSTFLRNIGDQSMLRQNTDIHFSDVAVRYFL